MHNQGSTERAPEFVFICGAVGSGNTFMFRCLTQDPSVFGVNEDGLGSTLNRLLLSEEKIGECPHSIAAFVDFMHALRRNQILVLKTPSNFRYIEAIRKHLPNSRFILMIREPHAAIVSGLSRHRAAPEKVAHTWLIDCEYLKQPREDSIVLTFEDLVRNPIRTLGQVADRILPLSPLVFEYANRSSLSDRVEPDRWKTMVDKHIRKEIEYWVNRLDLMGIFRAILSTRTEK